MRSMIVFLLLRHSCIQMEFTKVIPMMFGMNSRGRHEKQNETLYQIKEKKEDLKTYKKIHRFSKKL